MPARIGKTVIGPDQAKRADQGTYVWGEARNARGECKVARVHTANVYSLTIDAALAVVGYLLQTHPPGGAYTPARLLGADLVTRLPGSSAIDIERL